MAKITAKAVPYSSVVGGSIAIHDAKGAVVAILAVMVPDPSRDYKATAVPIIDHVVKCFPADVGIPARGEHQS